MSSNTYRVEIHNCRPSIGFLRRMYVYDNDIGLYPKFYLNNVEEIVKPLFRFCVAEAQPALPAKPAGELASYVEAGVFMNGKRFETFLNFVPVSLIH
jgi:hypothetical protein